jgi:hypothetical protein
MGKLLSRLILTALLIGMLPISAWAAVISSTAFHLSGNQWTYEYTVSASAAGPTIDEFTIFFDPTLFQNLSVAASPPGWDSLVVQPDPALPSDGFFDSLALVAGLAPGSSLGGFRVTFDFLGAGAPPAQRFDIVDPATFASLDSGMTAPAASVPEPSSLMLSLLALVLVAGWDLRSRRIKDSHSSAQKSDRSGRLGRADQFVECDMTKWIIWPQHSSKLLGKCPIVARVHSRLKAKEYIQERRSGHELTQ